jgi:hypothetical protein
MHGRAASTSSVANDPDRILAPEYGRFALPASAVEWRARSFRFPNPRTPAAYLQWRRDCSAFLCRIGSRVPGAEFAVARDAPANDFSSLLERKNQIAADTHEAPRAREMCVS